MHATQALHLPTSALLRRRVQAVYLCPASATLGEAETHKLLPTRAAPLPVWHNVATLLQHAAPRDSLSLEGLGLPADAAPGAFTHAGRAIIAAARGFTNLTDLELHMGFQGAAPGQPFHARLDAGAFPRLKRLVVQNANDGLDGEVMLTLGHMPWLRLLNVANAGRGGWVVLRSPLLQLETVVLINSCPRFASAESGLPGVRTLALFTRRARGKRRWGREMVGCGGLIESLPALEDVRVHGGVAGHYRLCKALKEHLDDAEQQVEARVQVLAFPYGVDSDGEHGA